MTTQEKLTQAIIELEEFQYQHRLLIDNFFNISENRNPLKDPANYELLLHPLSEYDEKVELVNILNRQLNQ